MPNQEISALDALMQRRSIRRFTDQTVNDAAVRTVLEAGRWAPSGLNNQPWRFMVLKKQDPRFKQLAECTKYKATALRADIQIVVLLDKESMYNPTKDHQGAGACIQNMLLAIHALGLGGVWLGEILNQEQDALQVLGISPQEYELMAVIALGHPDQQGSSDRKPLSELLLEDF